MSRTQEQLIPVLGIKDFNQDHKSFSKELQSPKVYKYFINQELQGDALEPS